MHISSSAKRTLDNNKFHKVIELPLTPDLLIVKENLQKKIEELVDSLKKGPILHDWRELSEVCITRLMTFNKRRSAEPTILLIERFSKRKDYSKGCSNQIMDTLSHQLKKRCYRGKKFFFKHCYHLLVLNLF